MTAPAAPSPSGYIGPPSEPWPPLAQPAGIYDHGQPRHSATQDDAPRSLARPAKPWAGETRVLNAPPSPPWPTLYDDPYRVRHGEPRTRANLTDYPPIFPRMGAMRP